MPLTGGAVAHTLLRCRLGPLRSSSGEGQASGEGSDRSAEIHRHDAGNWSLVEVLNLQTIDPATQMPPSNLLAYRRARPAPYLYSAAEIDALLEATDTLRPPLRAATYRTLLGLLAATGMRVGEAIALDRDDVDLRKGRLAIRAAKRDARQLRCTPRRSPHCTPTPVSATGSA